MLLGHDYVYAMKILASTLFRMIQFPYEEIFFTIDDLSSDNHHPNSTLSQVTPLYVPSIHVDSSPPWVNYMVSCIRCSIASRKEPLLK
jgi:hypothetical protein